MVKRYTGRKCCLRINKKHDVNMVNKYKITLNRDDDKRIVQADGINNISRGICSAFGLITFKDVFH